MSPTAVCSAPGRINLLGEHTDYNNGFALPIALQQRTTVTFTPDGTDGLTVAAGGHGTTTIAVNIELGDVDGWAAYIAGAVWSLRRAGHLVVGGHVRVDSDVPVGAGLSSSAALQCSMIGALTAHIGVPERLDWARIAQRAENDYVGAPTGLLDQLASLYGVADRALLIDFESLDVRPVRFDPGTHGISLLVLDSATTHGHAGGEYAARRESCDRAAAALGVRTLRSITDVSELSRIADHIDRRRARHVVTENRRVVEACDALSDNDYREFGLAMTESHASMRDAFEITTPAIDLIVRTAVDAGALGARMTGGGFGGCVIALVETDRVDSIIRTVVDGARSAGHPTPTAFVARAGRGASIDRVG